jgi:hypothetical protein
VTTTTERADEPGAEGVDTGFAGGTADGDAAPAPAGPPGLIRTDVGDRVAAAFRRWNQVDPTIWAVRLITFVTVVAASGWVFYTVHPGLILADTTPAGGDMGAHVWGPMYLMRHVLPHGQLAGWSPDWYAGFPAFQFYMVVPALVIIALTSGIHGPLVVPAVLICLAIAASGWFVVPLERYRKLLLGLGLALLVLAVPVPYNISFKLVSVSGLVALPACCWAFGKLVGLRFPTPPIMAAGALLFIYNLEPRLNGGTGNIIGGNMASTMAGEFAFSISVSLCVLYLGVLVRGLRTGRHRGLAALLLALTGLCHLIPVFFALTATVIIVGVYLAGDLFGRALSSERRLGWSSRLRWLVPVLLVAALLPAFWVLPFVSRHAYVNDMGWEKLPHANSGQDVWDYLWPAALRLPIIAAAVGFVVACVYRIRAGIALGITTVLVGAAFVHMPQARLWNARLLPFYYLCLFLLAALAIGELIRSVAVLLARDPEVDHPTPVLGIIAAPFVLVAVIIATGLPMLDVLPGAERDVDGVNRWPAAFDDVSFKTEAQNDVSGWARWNYSGYERKAAYAEYHGIVDTMQRLGADPEHGCGRALWEYGFDRLNPYGTPMALMLLPFWTDSCIGSMEGLFFESSTTTPYHFLMQTELSESPSSAQRDLPYSGFDLDRGVRHMQLLGVKYYMAFSPTAVQAAAQDDRLTEVAGNGPWKVYEVADSEVVAPLDNEPAVLTNVDDTQDQWLGTAVDWFLDPTRSDVLLANDGPDDWQRVEVNRTPVESTRGSDGSEIRPRVGTDVDLPEVEADALPPVEVSDIRTADNRISFDVDRPGVPVLVKASYFPNWEASGAEGPYRVAPNLMVVVPTGNHVEIHYGRTGIEWGSYALTALGIIGLIWLVRAEPVAMPVPVPYVPRPLRRPTPGEPTGPWYGPAGGPGPDPEPPTWSWEGASFEPRRDEPDWSWETERDQAGDEAAPTDGSAEAGTGAAAGTDARAADADPDATSGTHADPGADARQDDAGPNADATSGTDAPPDDAGDDAAGSPPSPSRP